MYNKLVECRFFGFGIHIKLVYVGYQVLIEVFCKELIRESHSHEEAQKAQKWMPFFEPFVLFCGYIFN